MKLFSSVFIYILNPINISLQFTLCIACLRFVLTQEASRLLVEGQLRAGALLGGSVGVSSLKASDWRSAKKQTVFVYRSLEFCFVKPKFHHNLQIHFQSWLWGNRSFLFSITGSHGVMLTSWGATLCFSCSVVRLAVTIETPKPVV